MSENEQSISASNGKSSSILLIDDNPEVARAMQIAFGVAGHTLKWESSVEAGFSRLAQERFDAILLDLNFRHGQTDGAEGMKCLHRIISEDPAANVIVMTAYGGVRTAVSAMQAGARDFAVKPWNNAELTAKVEKVIAQSKNRDGAQVSSGPTSSAPIRLIGESAAMEKLRGFVQRIGPAMSNVLITGPAGSGRTTVASALHAISASSGCDLLRIDVRDRAQWQRLDRSEGAALLRHVSKLDEISQERLLEALPDDLRIFAVAEASDALLAAFVRRVGVIEISVPSLAARGDDAIVLARHFIRVFAKRSGKAPPHLADDASDAIRAAQWHDEVRGLALAMERTVLLLEGDVIRAENLVIARPHSFVAKAPEKPSEIREFDLESTERTLIQAALREHGHNITRASQALGLSRAALYRRMERHGI